jgi:capsular polysaccharide biosynthesis protein
MEEIEFDIQDIFRVLKNNWRIMVCITIIVTIVVGAISFFYIKPTYRANTKVFIGKEQVKDVKYDSNDVEMYQKLLKTYAELIKTNDLIENAIGEKNLDIAPSQIMRGLEAVPRTDTQILQISYESNDNILAKEVLVAVVDEFIKESKVLIPSGTIKVIESADIPQYPVSPNKYRNTAIACLVGFMMGIMVALLKEYMNDTFKTKEQIEKAMEVSVIGMIPIEDKNYTKSKNKHITKTTDQNLKDQAYET